MDEISKILVIAGLSLDITGVLMLAWDVLMSPIKYWWPDKRQRNISLSEEQTAWYIDDLKNRPNPPWTKEMIDAEISKRKQTHEEIKERLEKEIEREKQGIDNEWVAIRLNFTRKGVLLIVSGFILQGVGTFLG